MKFAGRVLNSTQFRAELRGPLNSSLRFADDSDVSSEHKPVSFRQFTKDEKQELIEYLCRDCRPIPGGNYPPDLPQENVEDCGEYLEPNQYASFMYRFVSLLNIDIDRATEDRTAENYRKARFAVRRLWEVENGLPKCQVTALCQYVITGLETDRTPENEKIYSTHLSDSHKQVEKVIGELNSLRYLLQQ